MIERRTNPRINISGSVTLAFADEVLPAKLMNINPEGVQIELTSAAMALLGEHRSPDGAWPVTRLDLCRLAPDPEHLPTAADCEMVFFRRISQKIFIAGLRFVLPNAVTKDAMYALVKTLLLKQQEKRCR
jgi:hypothetical protein